MEMNLKQYSGGQNEHFDDLDVTTKGVNSNSSFLLLNL